VSETLHAHYQRDNHATGIITADLARPSARAARRSVRAFWRVPYRHFGDVIQRSDIRVVAVG
jgi:hypothetical protein